MLDKLLLTNAFGLRMVLSDVLSHGQLIPSLTVINPAFSPSIDACVSRYSGLVSSEKFIHVSSFI